MSFAQQRESGTNSVRLDAAPDLYDTFDICSPLDQPSGLWRGFVFVAKAGVGSLGWWRRGNEAVTDCGHFRNINYRALATLPLHPSLTDAAGPDCAGSSPGTFEAPAANDIDGSS